MAPDAALLLSQSTLPVSAETSLSTLSPAVRAWFVQRYELPTLAQRHAWPAIAVGNHLLLSAPTGSGKTLAAFSPILGELLARPREGLRCLYITPLKALGTDVKRTLRRCLRNLASFDSGPRVALRTGDTSARLRRRMLQRLPDILLTTPESLAVLLTQQIWVAHLSRLQWIIVDEVHVFAESKRGADLSLSLERLEEMAASPPQRIGLSATCAPLNVAAEWLVGVDRPCTVARVADTTAAQLAVEPLAGDAKGFIGRLVERLVPELEQNRTTLIFTNARGLAERLTWALRRRFPFLANEIAAHHSSLAAARRRQVERRLKQGRLRVVVSSTSLELGIDIGSVDRVVLVHPPGSVVRLLQRLGRSGHGPGQRRRGLVLTSTAGELLEAAVTCASSHATQLEPLRVPAHPLDVLCQQLLGMAAQRPWEPDEAFALVRRACPFRNLERGDFNDCLDYLSGRDCDGRDWLLPRLAWEDGCFRLCDQRTARILRLNLGTILTEEARPVRSTLGSLIGHVDEPFADRLEPGDRFLLDGRCLEYRRRASDSLEVDEVPGRPAVPQWGNDGLPMVLDLARRLFLLRVQAAEALRDGPAMLASLLRHDYGLTDAAVAELMAYFVQQDEVSEIPDARTLLIEVVPSEDMAECYLHTPLHRAGNDALARVAVHRLVSQHGRSCTSLVADLGFLLCVPGPPLQVEQWRQIFSAKNLDNDLDAALTESLTLRDRFRRVALTALMLLRNPLGRRRKVGGAAWPERRLFEQVRAENPDFVLLRQAMREVRAVCCDADAAHALAESLPNLTVRVRSLAAPSPFAQHWSQAVIGPGQSAQSSEEALRHLHAVLTTEVVCWS